MNRIILVRHGESMGNHDHDVYRRPDSAVCLTTKGVYQALALGDDLRNTYRWGRHQVAAYTSTLRRAQQTAQIVMDVAVPNLAPATVTPFLDEINYGMADNIAEFHRDPYARCTNGESHMEVRQRFGYWFESYIKMLLTSRDIIIFSHGGLIKGAVGYMLDLDPDDMMRTRTPNCCCITFGKNMEGKFYELP